MNFKVTINILKSSEEDIRKIIRMVDTTITKGTYSIWLTNGYREEPILTVHEDTSCTRANWEFMHSALHKDYQKHLIKENCNG